MKAFPHKVETRWNPNVRGLDSDFLKCCYKTAKWTIQWYYIGKFEKFIPPDTFFN